MDDPDWPPVQERTRAMVLQAFQQVHGCCSSKWHTQNVYVEKQARSRTGWTAEITVLDDPDNCSQYDESARWEASVEIRVEGEEVEVRGELKLVECGVARHLSRAERTLQLG